MRLTIAEDGAGELLYESVLERVEPRSYLAALDSKQSRSNCVLTMCSCCKRALLESVGWLELEDVVMRLRVFDLPEVPDLRYSVCPKCGQIMQNSTEDGNAACQQGG